MAIMVCKRNGETLEFLVSGYTPGEEKILRDRYETQGYTVAIRYGVWR